jgi:hypothetical protein
MINDGWMVVVGNKREYNELDTVYIKKGRSHDMSCHDIHNTI